MSHNFGLSLFLQKKLQFLLVVVSSKHFLKYLKLCTFSKKSYEYKFVANLPSFQKNFKLLKSVARNQSYA